MGDLTVAVGAAGELAEVAVLGFLDEFDELAEGVAALEQIGRREVGRRGVVREEELGR